MGFSKTIATLLVVASGVAGCAGNSEKENVVAQNDVIDDFIKVAELPEQREIRHQRDLQQKDLTDEYILIYDGKKPYLLAFERPCRELNDVYITPDIRHEAHTLHARLDTFRGCRIKSLYELTPGQAAELRDLVANSIE